MEQTFSCPACKRDYPLTMRNEGHAIPANETFSAWHANYTAYLVSNKAIVLPICTSCVKKEARPVYILLSVLTAIALLLIVLGFALNLGKWSWSIGLVLLLLAVYLAVESWPSPTDCSDTIAVRTIFSSLNRREQNDKKAKLFTRKERSKLR
jgi:hypothetical protein